MLKVSVIIPFYKNALTIERALHSILNQSSPVSEIVIVNDDSPDREALIEVLKRFPEVKLVNNTTNKGLAYSRNNGVLNSTGDVLCFLDADDEVHPQKIEIQLKLLTSKNAITCNNKVISNSSETYLNRLYTPDSFRYRIFKTPYLVAYRNNLTGAGMMISRDLFEAIGGYDEDLRSAEDYDLWLRLLEVNIQVVLIQLPLYMWYFNPHGLSKNYYSMSVQEFSAVQKHLNRIKKNSQLLTLHNKLILFIFIVRQYYRYEKCLDSRLLTLAQQNHKNFRVSHSLSFMIKVILFSRILKIPTYLNKIFRSY